MFSRSRNSFLIFLLSYHVWVTSKIQVNFWYRLHLKVLMILSYEFSKFLQYLCFKGQGIHCCHSQWAVLFEWPRKSRSTSDTGGTRRYWWLCLIAFGIFFTIYVFEVKESIADIPTELPCSGWSGLNYRKNFLVRKPSLKSLNVANVKSVNSFENR